MARLRWFGIAVVAGWTLAALLPSRSLHAQASSCSGTIEGVVRDVNGQPLAGWMVWLLDGEGRPFGLPYLTSQDGSYTFSGLPCGNYTVYEVINSGWTQVFPSAGGGSYLLNIGPSAQAHTGIDFRNRLGTCTAQGDLVDVFSSGFDEDANRVLGLNPSEVDDDWVMTALYDQPSCWGTGPLPADPNLLVLGPPRPASSYVGHTAWAQALDNSQWVSSWQSSGTPNGWHFYQHCFCLTEGFSDPFLDMALYADDAASVLLNGTEILRTPNPAFQVATGPENGVFLVDPATLLHPGVNCLTVAVCNQARVVTGFDIAGIFTAKDGLCCHRPGRLCGTKWKDLDGDGRRQPGEPGLGDWTIQLRDASGKIVATQKTDADGSYCFLNLDPGAYTVAEVVPPAPRWIVTAPPRPHSVQLAPGQEVVGLDFGNLLCPDPNDPFVTYFGRTPNRRPCTFRFSCPSPNEQPFLNACGCGCVPKRCTPELEISKRPSHVGSSIEGYYQIFISNVGTCPSGSPLVFTDTLPPGLAYAGLLSPQPDWSCKQEGGALDPVTVTCSYGGPELQPGETAGLVLRVQPGPSSEATQNCASLMAEGTGGEACTAKCADAGEDRNVCPPGPNPGERIGTPARDGCTYRWSPASGLSDPNVARPVVRFPLDGGSATYRVDVQCRDCSGTDWITLNQRAVPGSIPLNGKGTGRFCGKTWTFNLSGHTGDRLVWECARKANGPWQACPGSADHPKYTANAGRRRLWVRARVLCGSSQGYSNTVLLDPTPFCR